MVPHTRFTFIKLYSQQNITNMFICMRVYKVHMCVINCVIHTWNKLQRTESVSDSLVQLNYFNVIPLFTDITVLGNILQIFV